ncbi:MAG: adenylate cyclase [Acidobacteriota bacterium]|jgi:adenylate cyclase|nr:adenylate cyclase [Acidobacteriota bacterium]
MAVKKKKSFVSDLLRRRYWALAIGVTLIIWAGLALAMRPMKDADGTYGSHPYGLMDAWENQSLDLLFQLRDVLHPERRTRGLQEPITIIEVDEASIRASNVRLQKWPRTWYAKLIDRASEGGASVIGLDLYLSEAGGTTQEDKAADQQLVASIENAGNVVLAQKLEAGGIPAIKPLPEFADAAWGVGFVDLPFDSDNSVRSAVSFFKARQDGETQLSFAAAVAQGFKDQTLTPAGDENLLLGERVLPLRKDRNLQLDFRGRTPAFNRVSARDILCGAQVDPPLPCEASQPVSDDLFRDHIVLIGATNNDAPDLFQTPFYKSSALARLFDKNLSTIPARMPGVELHANSAATMLFGNSPVRPRYGWQILLLLVPLGLVAFAVFRLQALLGLLLVVLVAAGALAVSSWAFNRYDLILPLASAWLGIGLLAPVGLGVRYARERMLREDKEAERAQVMDILSRCVSPDVAEELWQRREHFSLSGERRVVTLIFTDIRNFTTLSESVSSEKVVEWLNEYFTRMNNIVTKFGGHINKFIGDGLMIVFGAPAERGEKVEAQAAVACGLAMLSEVERINEDWAGTDRPQLAIGVGIHTGVATCGVAGAEQRLEYTVIGDTVNLAARLESTTKEFVVPILISEATAERLEGEYETEPLGEVKVKGKTMNTAVYTVRKKAAEISEAAETTQSAGVV